MKKYLFWLYVVSITIFVIFVIVPLCIKLIFPEHKPVLPLFNTCPAGQEYICWDGLNENGQITGNCECVPVMDNK